jgi:hypothetical protein
MKRLLGEYLYVPFPEKIGVSVGDVKAKVRPQPTCHVENALSCLVVASHGISFEVIKKLQDNVEIVSLDSPIGKIIAQC